MRRKNLQRALAGIAAMGALAGGTAALAATSGQLTLSGTVQQILTVTVTPAAAASGLDLTGSVSQLKVATILAEANNPAGYSVSVSSLNQGGSACDAASGPCFLSPTATTNDNLGFSILRDAVAVSFSGDTGTFISSGARSSVGGDSYDANISYDGTSANLDQATDYSETLTFTISES